LPSDPGPEGFGPDRSTGSWIIHPDDGSVRVKLAVHSRARCPQFGRDACGVTARLATLSGMNLLHRIARRVKAMRSAVERGMSTAEYAVGTVAAVAFAVVLYKIVRSPEVSSALSSIVQKALHAI
jgi:hypothetical protein